MHTRLIVLAAVVAALAGFGNQAWGQYDPAAYGGAPPPMYGGGAARQAGFGRIGGGMGAMNGGMGAMNGGMGANLTQPPSCGYEGYPGGGYGDGGCCGDCCPAGAWCHHIGVFAEGLYLRPRNVEIAYAVAVSGDGSPDEPGPYQQDHVRVLDPDYQPGFRGGINFACGECSMVELSYTRFNADADDFYQLETGLEDVVISELVGPDPLNNAFSNSDAEAVMDIKWEQIDADYLGLLAYCDSYRVAYSVGVRYSKLDQEFAALYSPQDTRLVASNIEFEGAGLKFGGLAERYGCNHNLYVYGKTDVAFLGGEFRADYFSDAPLQGPLVDTSWKAGRLVTVHDMEVGIGWQNCSGCIRLQTGYMYSVWYNVVKTQEWINAVARENNFADPSDNFYGLVSFDGFTSRVEFLW